MNSTTKFYKSTLNLNTNKQSEKREEIRQNIIKQHVTKMSQRKQKYTVKTHVKHENINVVAYLSLTNSYKQYKK